MTVEMSASAQQVYVLDDQPEIGEIVRRALEDHGLAAQCFTRAKDFQRRLKIRRPDLCIVDLGLADEDGLSVVRDVRIQHQVPVIILTGRGGVIDRVLGLEIGADDYIVKPFDARELVARVKAVLRRSRPSPPAATDAGFELARFGTWTFDFDTHTLTERDGAAMELSAAEAHLLLAFLMAPNRILSRDSLLGLRGGQERSPYDRSIDVRVSRLRQKLEANPKSPQIIRTVYGAGYMFTARVEWLPKRD